MFKNTNYNDLYAFLQVALEKSFNKAAQKIGISSPALSKKIHVLERQLGIQLFNRTTRKVALTQAGEQLFRTVQISFSKLDNELALLEHHRNSPSGTVKINCGLQVIETLLIPKLAHFKQQYPDIQLELISENRFVDIIHDGFDAGIRFGSDVADGMVAIRISDPMKMAVVASASYFDRHGIPTNISELTQHQCICYRLTNGQIFQWHFNDNDTIIKIKPQGQWIFNDDYPTLTAVKLGLGIGYLPIDLITHELERDQLIAIFQEKIPPLPALHLYYPHRNVSSALRVVIDSLKR